MDMTHQNKQKFLLSRTTGGRKKLTKHICPLFPASSPPGQQLASGGFKVWKLQKASSLMIIKH